MDCHVQMAKAAVKVHSPMFQATTLGQCIHLDSARNFGFFALIYCDWPWPAAYININQNTHQIQVLTKPLCRAQAIFYSLPNNEWGTKYRGLNYSAN